MTLRIEFDYQIFSLQRHGGISRYFTEIAQRLSARPGLDVGIVCPLHINEYLLGLPRTLVSGRQVPQLKRTARLRHWLNASLSRVGAGGRAPGICHWTYYRTDTRPGWRNVVTVYDMAHERFPEQFPAQDPTSRNKAAAVARADAVICISQHTRKELLELLPVDPAKVFVTHLGYTPLPVREGFAPPAAIAAEPFILYVGNRGGYKNFETLLKAYGSAQAIAGAYRLVCLGGGRFTESEEKHVSALGLKGRVLQLPADDAFLAYAYAHAQAFAYPSVYEGFGIPPLEAMSGGCPVVCGRNTSLAEVVGDAACIVDPADEASLARGLETVLGSPEERERLRKAGLNRATLFSWDKCAEETLSVYRGLGRSGSGDPSHAAAPAVHAPRTK